MGFSSQQYRREFEERPWKINPVWRGIGCFLLILIPIMAWFGASILLQSNLQIIRTPEFNRPITFKYTNISEIDCIIADVNKFTVSNNLVGGQFFYFFILAVAGFGVLAFFYAVIYKIAGPPRYGPFDVPPTSMRR